MAEELDIETRLVAFENKLINQQRINRLFAIALLTAFAVLAYFYIHNSEIIKSNGFQLLDSNGQVAAELSVRGGKPGLYIMDEKTRTRLALFHSKEATGLHLKDEFETTRVGAVQFSHGGGGFALHGEESKGAAVLYYKKKGVFDCLINRAKSLIRLQKI